MAVIKTYKTFNGESMGVAFSNGEGSTENPWLIQRFKESGYQVEEPEKDEKPEEPVEEPEKDEKDESASAKKASPAKTRSTASKAKAK